MSLVIPVGLKGGRFVGALDQFESVVSDVYTPSWRLLTSYTGPLVRVRRSSDDVESDIGFHPQTGYINLEQLSSFLGGSTAYVTKVYNQKGIEYFANTTPTQQPILTTSSGWTNKIAMVFDGVDDTLTTSGVLTPTAILAGAHVTSLEGGIARVFSGPSGDNSVYLLTLTSATLRFGNSSAEQTSAVTSVVGTRYEMHYDSTAPIVYASSETVAAAAAGFPLQAGTYYIGAFSGISQHMGGSLPYFITLNTFLGSTDRARLRTTLSNKYPV